MCKVMGKKKAAKYWRWNKKMKAALWSGNRLPVIKAVLLSPAPYRKHCSL